jgi:hypothetical protein
MMQVRIIRASPNFGRAGGRAGRRRSHGHDPVIRLPAEGRRCAAVARLTGFVRRQVEERVARHANGVRRRRAEGLPVAFVC